MQQDGGSLEGLKYTTKCGVAYIHQKPLQMHNYECQNHLQTRFWYETYRNRGSGSQSEKATELYRGTSQKGTYAVRYDARIESAPWNGVVGELEDAELQMITKLRIEIPQDAKDEAGPWDFT